MSISLCCIIKFGSRHWVMRLVNFCWSPFLPGALTWLNYVSACNIFKWSSVRTLTGPTIRRPSSWANIIFLFECVVLLLRFLIYREISGRELQSLNLIHLLCVFIYSAKIWRFENMLWHSLKIHDSWNSEESSVCPDRLPITGHLFLFLLFRNWLQLTPETSQKKNCQN